MVIDNGSMNCAVFTQWNTCFNCVFLGSVICLLLGTHLSQGQTNGPSCLPLSLASQLLWECKTHITTPFPPPNTNSNTCFHFLPVRGCPHRYIPTGSGNSHSLSSHVLCCLVPGDMWPCIVCGASHSEGCCE